MRGLWSFVCGLVFSAGVCISGMVRPEKILAFLDFTRHWDPSLMFVMVGAIGVYALAWRIARVPGRTPILGGTFPPRAPRNIDLRLVGGAAIFGVGWGLGGFCPGPAIAATVSGATDPLIFVAALLGGTWLYQLVDAKHGAVDETREPAPLPQTT